MLSFIFSITYTQGAGVGQGYFSAVNAPGPAGFVNVFNGAEPVRLVITRWGDVPFTVDILPNSAYSVGIGNINTIGILNLGAGTATGTLTFNAII